MKVLIEVDVFRLMKNEIGSSCKHSRHGPLFVHVTCPTGLTCWVIGATMTDATKMHSDAATVDQLPSLSQLEPGTRPPTLHPSQLRRANSAHGVM